MKVYIHMTPEQATSLATILVNRSIQVAKAIHDVEQPRPDAYEYVLVGKDEGGDYTVKIRIGETK